MNDYARRRIINDRINDDYGYENRRDRDYENRRDYSRDYDDMYDTEDYRRGVRGSRRRDYAYSMDGHAPRMELTKHDMLSWKRNLVNADGSVGERFKFDEIMEVAEKMRLRFDSYSEKDLCMTVNMLYSDFCKALKHMIPQDKELYVYVALADAFLNDEDGPEGSEKLALYYHYIVKNAQ